MSADDSKIPKELEALQERLASEAALASEAQIKADASGLTPHPLVVGLASSLFGGKSASEAQQIAARAVVARKNGESLGDDDLAGTLRTFVEARNRWELVKFVGYLADSVGHTDPDGWQVLFLDDTAESYLLVRISDIKFHARLKDERAAFGHLDALWVKGDARVTTGGRMESLVARYTSGGFMRAGDFRASMVGGTTMGAFAAATSDSGPLCTSVTPCCCGRNSH